MKLALYFFAIFALSQSAALARWAAAPPDVIGFWRLSAAALMLLPFAWKPRSLHQLWSERREKMPLVILSAVFFSLTFGRSRTRPSTRASLIA